MKFYVITRTSVGYGELESVVVKAPNEDAARLWIIRHNSGMPGVDAFANPDYSTAVEIDDDATGIIAQTYGS